MQVDSFIRRCAPCIRTAVFLQLLFVLSAATLHASELMDKGIKEFRAENFEESLVIFKKARQEEPDNSVAAYYLGLACKHSGLMVDAVENFKAAVSLTPAVQDAYPELVDSLYNNNELQEARIWIAKAERENILPGRMAFLSGMVFAKEGRNAEAIAAFEKAGKLDESLSQAAYMQIAMAYAGEKKPVKAKEALKAVITVAPDTELASFAREYDAALTEALSKYKSWRFNAGVTYSYDDNIVSKPSTVIPGVIISGEKGYYAAAIFSANYSPLPMGPWSLTAAYNVYSSHYRNTNSHNLMSHSLSVTPGHSFDKSALTFPVSYNLVWLKERRYQSVTSVKPTFTIMAGPADIFQASAGFARRDLVKPAIDPNENRNGDVYSMLLGYIHPYANGAMVNFRYERTMDMTDGRNWENEGDELNLGGIYPVTGKVGLLANAGYMQQEYQKESTVFLKFRHDKIYNSSISAKTELLKDLNLTLTYGWTKAVSNIPVYDYKRNHYTAGLDYSF